MRYAHYRLVTGRIDFSRLQRIYGFYGAKKSIQNVHLPTERHDFGPNKRKAVYAFFAEFFGLDSNAIDEDKVTIEPESALYSFGEKGEKLPSNAIRSFDQLASYLNAR